MFHWKDAYKLARQEMVLQAERSCVKGTWVIGDRLWRGLQGELGDLENPGQHLQELGRFHLLLLHSQGLTPFACLAALGSQHPSF